MPFEVSRDDGGVGTKGAVKGRKLGLPPLNQGLFARSVSAVSCLMKECPEIKELDINPLIQMKDGNLTAVDSVIKLEWSVCWKQRKTGNNTRKRRCAPR